MLWPKEYETKIKIVGGVEGALWIGKVPKVNRVTGPWMKPLTSIAAEKRYQGWVCRRLSKQPATSGVSLPSLQEIFPMHYTRKASSIMHDSSHPLHGLLTPLAWTPHTFRMDSSHPLYRLLTPLVQTLRTPSQTLHTPCTDSSHPLTWTLHTPSHGLLTPLTQTPHNSLYGLLTPFTQTPHMFLSIVWCAFIIANV